MSENSVPRRLTRSASDRMIAGVCAGQAEYFGVDPTLVRLGWVGAAVLTGGAAVIGYIVCWVITPKG